jgi:hypothetical protein
MRKNEIVPIEAYAKDINYNYPDDSFVSNKSVATSIKNAWKESCIIDNRGTLWVSEEKLHIILRNNPTNTKYLVASMNRNDKMIINNVTFIRGCEVLRLIDNNLQNAGRIAREKYLRYSNDNYNSIRDCNEVQLIRAEYYENIKEFKKRLKKKKIQVFANDYGIAIEYDELSGEVLTRGSNFSHIRSCSIYPDLIDNIFNGHIVNEDTHDIITSRGVNDERELLQLCIEMNWNTQWYDSYVRYFGELD